MDRDYTRITHALATHGDFFERRCASEVAAAGWSVVQEEFPVSLQGETGAIDIWAQKGNGRLNAIIEAKRSHPNFRVWLFYEGAWPTQTRVPIVYRKKGQNISGLSRELEIFSDVRGINLKPADRASLIARELPQQPTPDASLKSYEAANRARGGRPPAERIYHACFQVALGLKSVIRDEVQVMQHSAWRTGGGGEPLRIFFPLVVTTADLLVCNLSPENVSIETGDIDPRHVEYREEKWLVYFFPLPEAFYLRPLDGLGNEYRQGKYEYDIPQGVGSFVEGHLQHLPSVAALSHYRRLPVVVVKARHLKDCLQRLEGVQLVEG